MDNYSEDNYDAHNLSTNPTNSDEGSVYDTEEFTTNPDSSDDTKKLRY